MIALDDNGNFIANDNGLLANTNYPNIQNAKSECRCMQGEWLTDILYGKNFLVWELSSSPNDRCNDLFIICAKYYEVRSVIWNQAKERFIIE
jgi:hypothetical protein